MLFLEQLKQKKYQILYESEELWLFEIPAHQLPEFISSAQKFHGLTTDISAGFMAAAANDKSYKVIIYAIDS